MNSGIFRTAFVAVLLSLATPQAFADEFKWQDGIGEEAYGELLNLDANGPTTTDLAAAVPSSDEDVQVSTGFFDVPGVSAPGAVDKSFSGVKFTIQIDGR